jgi:uncharacterized protein YndB with AHSA1/START domain
VTALALAVLLAPPAAASDADRVLIKTATVRATPAQAWRAWSTSAGAREFFGPRANIGKKAGEPYEIYFDLKDERQSTKGLKIMDVRPGKLIAFQWNAPPQFPAVRKAGTSVTVSIELRKDGTAVTLAHSDWQDGPEWDAAYEFFDKAWDQVMERLERRFKTGPIDWSKEG